VAETVRAYAAFKEGQLHMLWPNIPAVLMDAVMMFARELNVAHALAFEIKHPPKGDGDA